MVKECMSLIQIPLGRMKADKVIVNGKILNVFTEKIMDGCVVAITGSRIAYVGPSTSMVGEDTEVIDARGLFLVPGYIDAHGHSDYVVNPIALTKKALPRGTTTILSDTHEMAGALEVKGIQAMLDMTEDLPIKFFLAVPATTPSLPELEGNDSVPYEEFCELMRHPRVRAVSELLGWQRVIDLDETVLEKLSVARSLGKRIEGHAAGCSVESLSSLINAGVTSCHESISAQDVRDRLTTGLYTMLRQGSIRRDMDVMAEVFTSGEKYDDRWVMLTPDWFSPKDVRDHGYMDFVIKEAIRCGIEPIKAIKMATINPALYLGMDREIGGIGPGRYADILFLPALDEPTPSKVMVEGQVVAENGNLKMVVNKSCPRFNIRDWRTGRLPQFALEEEDFMVKAAEKDGRLEEVPIMVYAGSTILKFGKAQLPVRGGYLSIKDNDLLNESDLLKVSVLHRDGNKFLTCFLKAFGARIGGMAISIAHDHHSPFVIGTNEKDMVQAYHRMMKLNGGIVIIENEEVMAECPLRVGGVMSDRDIIETARNMEAVEDYLIKNGCASETPLVVLAFLGFMGLPYARMTPSGLYDVRHKKIVFARSAYEILK